MENAEAPMMEPMEAQAEHMDKPEDEMALMQADNNETKADADEPDLTETCPCCCCFCQCSTHKTADLKCFGCFPIRFGIALIGMLTVFLTIAIYCEVFFFLLNEHAHWWYVVVAIVLLIPLIMACSWFILFFSQDNNDTRGKLDTACMFAIISFSLLAIWNLLYFLIWYKNPTVDFGTQWSGYYTQTKKTYIFLSLFTVFWLDAFYGYFLCATRRYWYRLKPADEKPKEDMMDMVMGTN